MDTLCADIKDIDLSCTTLGDLGRMINRIKYKTDETFRENIRRHNKLQYQKKNEETNNGYKGMLNTKMKEKYKNNEEYREKTKQVRRERYHRQKEERLKQAASEQEKLQ